MKRITRSHIQRYVQQVAKQFQPDKIILFSSYAYGEPTEDSDVDLLVIMPFDGKGAHKSTEIRVWQYGQYTYMP